MNQRTLFGMLVLVLLPVMGSASGSLEAQFKEILPLCGQFFLPNSMARTSGSDINEELREVEGQIEKRSGAFRSSEGMAYLNAILKVEKDDLSRACIRYILKQQDKP